MLIYFMGFADITAGGCPFGFVFYFSGGLKLIIYPPSKHKEGDNHGIFCNDGTSSRFRNGI